MATWKQIKDFIRNSFELQEDKGDFFKLILYSRNDRSQRLFIEKRETQSGAIWMQIASPIGIIEDYEINDALEMLYDKICGGMVKIGKKHYIRECLPIDDLLPEQFVVIMKKVASIADKMEERFVGGDNN